MLIIKAVVITVIGATGGIFARWFGGFDQLLSALITFMIIDIISGWQPRCLSPLPKQRLAGYVVMPGFAA